MVNLTIYLMLIVLNCGDMKLFIETFFEKDSKVLALFMEIIKKTKNFDVNKRIEKNLHNFFLDEYRILFFNHKLDNLFILNHEKYKEYLKTPVEVFPKSVYFHLLEFLTNFEMNYDSLFNNKKYMEEEKPLSTFTLKIS